MPRRRRMAHDARSNSPHADPLGESSPEDQGAKYVAGGVSDFGASFVRYVRYYEKLRAEGVGVEEAMKLVRDKLEREQARH
jgi:hypothetical protein